MLWNFKGFVDDQGRPVIDEWYKTLPSAAQVKLDWIVDLFKTRSAAQWGATKFFKKYRGLEGIFEVKWETGKKWYRMLGAFVPERMDFTFLIGTEKEQKNIRLEEEESAVKRLDVITNDPNRAQECNFESEDEKTASEETSE